MPELIQEPEAPVSSTIAPRKVSRRNMLMTFGIALNAIAGALFAVPVVGYIFGPARRKEMKKELAWITLGPLTQFPVQVFAINCAHLGCPVRWYPQSGLFMCPCHGGAYYADGSRASGPPPRGLFEYDYKLEAGQIWIKAGQVPTLASPPSQACADQPKRCACA